jgi:hypothetical protein
MRHRSSEGVDVVYTRFLYDGALDSFTVSKSACGVAWCEKKIFFLSAKNTLEQRADLDQSDKSTRPNLLSDPMSSKDTKHRQTKYEQSPSLPLL